MKQRLSIFQGDSDTLTGTVSNITSLAGYTVKLFIKKKDGTAIDTITGSTLALVNTYPLLNENTKLYPIGEHDFETKAFDTSDHVITLSKGIFEVKVTINNDPS